MAPKADEGEPIVAGYLLRCTRRRFVADGRLPPHTTAPAANVSGVHHAPPGVHHDINASHANTTSNMVQPIANHGVCRRVTHPPMLITGVRRADKSVSEPDSQLHVRELARFGSDP